MISMRSAITRSVLGYFMLHQDSRLYVNEIARRLSLDNGNLTKKLKELEKEGILQSEEKGKERYYFLNRRYPLLGEYKRIILKTVGFESLLKTALEKVRGIKSAFIYGSYAKDKMDVSSDIDLIVIGDHSVVDLQRKLAEVQKNVDREINIKNMSAKEFNLKKARDPLLVSVLKGKKIVII